MISGRCSLLSTVRYVSELFKKRHCRDHGKVTSLIVGVSPVRGLQINRSDKRSPAVIFLSMRMASTSSGTPESSDDPSLHGKNRLALEKSPYLLQHANNPVQWYPWGEEALEKARKENKLIFLSVGYSTCHWCHVMERESFENPAIAEIMNKYFVNIKVDREERPDIDRIYMNFIQSMSGHGGWPMSVFLLPDLTPIIGGTYFPPEDKYGQPGFKQVLLSVAGKWIVNQEDILATGSGIRKVLKRVAELADRDHIRAPEECGTICVYQLTQAYEPNYGGFSDAPKFPHTANFNFLFHMYARSPKQSYNEQCLEMCVHTLKMIAKGGIHDHVGQGFSRYSVDSEWHVPHFEKMLYDQAMLMQSYADAFVATKNPLFAEVIDDIATYVTRDLRHKDGGFYSAEDADSFPTENATQKREGAFYVWTYDEIKSLLSKNIPNKEIKLVDLFCHYFAVTPRGNVTRSKDPHNELTGKNVLIITGSLEETAEHFGIPVNTAKACLQDACKILFEERSKRPRPHLDDKMITAWNGLMISGLARATSATNDQKYANYAVDTAKFIERYLYDKEEGVLLRSCYRDKHDNIVQPSVPIHGFHVDYAYVVKGLLDLYEATFDTRWIAFAEQLQNIQNELFWDKEHYGYYATMNDDSVIVRFKEDHDGTEPSSNSVACGNLLKLAAYLDNSEFLDMAGKLLHAFEGQISQKPIMLPEMVAALLHYHDSTTQIYIVGKPGSKDTDDLIRVVRGRLIPGKVLGLIDPQNPADILLRNEVVTKMKPQNGSATVYVCRHHSCSLPVTSAEELVALLDERE